MSIVQALIVGGTAAIFIICIWSCERYCQERAEMRRAMREGRQP